MCVAAIPVLVAGAAKLGAAATAVTSSSWFAPLMGLASAGLKIAETYSNLNAQNKYAEAQGEATNAAVAQDYLAINQRIAQDDMATAIEQTERVRQGMRERSKIIVSSGEAGVSGNSPMRELMVSLVGQGYDSAILETNQDYNRMQARQAMAGSYLQGKGQIDAINASLPKNGNLDMAVSGVSGFVSGLGAASALSKGTSFLLDGFKGGFIKAPGVSRLAYR